MMNWNKAWGDANWNSKWFDPNDPREQKIRALYLKMMDEPDPERRRQLFNELADVVERREAEA